MMSEVLKACPWCAEMPNTDDGRNTDYGPRVWCANFPHCPVEPVAEGRTLADAITAWNTRTPAVATDEGVVACQHGIRHPWQCDECDEAAEKEVERVAKAIEQPFLPHGYELKPHLLKTAARAAISATKETHDE